MKRVVCTTVSSALVLASCTSANGGLSTSAINSVAASNQIAEFDNSGLSAGDALVVIRYPAFVDEDAKTAFYERYIGRPIGDSLDRGRSYIEGAEQLSGAFMLKNHYFAVSLYKALKRRLPEDTVLLSPHLISFEPGKGLSSAPVLSSEEVPHALTVDFTSYTFPDSEKLLDANAVTFGDIVTPLAVVRTDHLALPATNGLIAASAPMATAAWNDAAALAMPTSLVELDAPADSHILIDHIDPKTRSLVPGKLRIAKPMGKKISFEKIDILPVEKIQMDSSVIERLSKTGDGLDADPFGPVYSNGFANRIVAYLNALELPKTTAAAKQQAVAAFDYDAAHLYFAAAEDNDVDTRVRFAERILKAERRYLAGQSDALESSMGPDQFGRQLAELFVAEQDNLDQRREILRKQKQRQGLAILGAIAAAGAFYAASKSGGNVSSSSSGCRSARSQAEYSRCVEDVRRYCQERSRTNREYQNCVDSNVNGRSGGSGKQQALKALGTLSLGLMAYGFISAKSKKAQGKMVGANFLSTIAPSLNESSEVTVDLLEGSEAITAANYPELRDKMLSLYSRRMRSMGVSAVPCTFSAPDVTSIGTWYGPCEGGAASGNGYGVITADGAAQSVEYYGEAAGGYASGKGYLIRSGGAGAASVSYEGGFLAGRPHGIVTMSSTGKAEKSAVYENGKRIGRVPKDQPLPQVFSSNQQTAVYYQ